MNTIIIENPNTLLSIIEILEDRVKRGDKIEVSEFQQIEEALNKDELIDDSLISLLKNKLLKLRKITLEKDSVLITKWDMFVLDMSKIEGIDEINKFIKYINNKKDESIKEQELKEIELKYKNILPSIHEKLSIC